MPSGRDGGLTPRVRPERRSAADRSRSRRSGLFSARRPACFRLGSRPAARRPRRPFRGSAPEEVRSPLARLPVPTDTAAALRPHPLRRPGRHNRIAVPRRPAERSAPVGTVRIARGRAMPARGSPLASLRPAGSRQSRLIAHRRATLAGLAAIRGHPPLVSRHRRLAASAPGLGRSGVSSSGFACPRAVAYRLYDPTSPGERQHNSRSHREISVHGISSSQHPIPPHPQPYPQRDAALPCSARALTVARGESKSVSRRDNSRFSAPRRAAPARS